MSAESESANEGIDPPHAAARTGTSRFAQGTSVSPSSTSATTVEFGICSTRTTTVESIDLVLTSTS